MTDEKNKKEDSTQNLEVAVLNKFTLDLVALADKGRDQQLNCIHFTSDFTEVTNGHYLMRINNVKISAEDYPLGPGGEKICSKPFDVLIPADIAKKIQRNIPVKLHLPILQHAVPSGIGGGKVVEFATYDLDVWSVCAFRASVEKFPDTDMVIPKEKPEVEIGFDPEYMFKLCQQFKKNGITTVRLSIRDPEGAMVLDGINPETDQEVYALLMPMKL